MLSGALSNDVGAGSGSFCDSLSCSEASIASFVGVGVGVGSGVGIATLVCFGSITSSFFPLEL